MNIVERIVHYVYDEQLMPLTKANAANYISLLGAWLSRLGLLHFIGYLIAFGIDGCVSPRCETIRWIGILLFALGSACDGIDGFVARRWNITSAFGEIYDPHLDKVQYVTKVNGLMIDAFVAVLCGSSWQFFLQAVVVSWITQERDLTIMFHRLWSVREDPKMKISARPSGKWRTRICFPAILIMFLVIRPLDSVTIGWILTAIIFAITAYSAYDYVKTYRNAIKAARLRASHS